MRTTFLERRLAVEAEVDVPETMFATRRLVRFLGYPVEMFSVSNRAIPPTAPTDNPDSFPRVNVLDASAFLLWVVLGDYAYDRGASTLTGPNGSLSEEEIRARPLRGAVDSVPALSSRDRGWTFTPSVFAWWRTFDVSPNHYVTLYGFTGGAPHYSRDSRPPAGLAGLVGSLRFRDYS